MSLPSSRHRLIPIAALALIALPAVAQFGPSTVEVADVREEMLGATVYLTGDLQTARQAVIGAEVQGRVAERLIDEGSAVEAGDPLIRLDARLFELEVARDEARLAGAQAELNRQRIDYESQRALQEEGVIGETEFAEVVGAYHLAEAQVAEAEAELGLSRERLERATITAPFAGVIAGIHTEVGQWLREGGDVAELLATDELEVVVDVPETAVPRLRLGMRGVIMADALPGQTFEGELIAIEPAADLMNRTYPIHIRVNNPPPELLPGMFIRVAVETNDPAPTLLMSADALVDRGRGPEVWVVAEGLEGLTANPRRIDIGRRRGADIEVLRGLEEGERVVVAGTEFLIPGGPVMIAGEGGPPMGPPDAAATSGESPE
ncbi:efflux RND transporter periplasmic adaptor subunit [Candidatus Sumerlaeota bacterium]|nr:efflux RND transporter periplasmic adaptor subunit [Candidatus Sumerlaeota bacterium]